MNSMIESTVSLRSGWCNAALAALLLATTALTSPVMLQQASAQNLPTGGSVAAGSVAIAQPSATQLNITQSSQSAVVNWQSFSVGQGSAVNIVQPNASSALLNRVTGNTPSSIAGSITANGQVYLVNPNGIAITSSGTINTGGFVASTLGISESDFMSGKRTFTGNGASADVSNAGTINIGRGGYAALIGGTVSNSGYISVPLGKVGLGSGEQATLDFSGDGFLQVALPTNANGEGALIRNSGTIKANGGSVIMSAATAREAARDAINISGIVQARSISGHNGSISIGGGAGGKVAISGKMTTASRRGKGGAIAVTGKDIALTGATLNASGKTGGGTINIGGGWQGAGSLQHADTTTIDAATTIKADAAQTGNGGTVVVWSDLLTTFAGNISAKGGALSGNGGEAEVSGKQLLDFDGAVNLLATAGTTGTLLLDPVNITISTSTSNNIAGTLLDGTTTYNPTTTTTSVVRGATLQSALGTSNVVINAAGAGTAAGTITVSNALTWASANSLTLNATSNITVSAAITATSGTLVLNPGAGSTVAINSAVNVTTLAINGTGAVTQSNSAGNAITATNLALVGGANYTLTNASNKIGTLAANAGTLSLADSIALTIGAVTPSTGGTISGITTNGATTISSTGNIAVNAAVRNTSNAATVFTADSAGSGNGAITVAGGSFSSPGAITLRYSAAGGGSVNTTQYTNQPVFANAGSGTLSAYMNVNSVTDLQNVQNNLSGSYTITKNIDASATAGWNSGAGFVPIGNLTAAFTGKFDGAGYTITGLTINLPFSTSYVGLFGSATNATLANIGLLGGSVTGGSYVGGLVGALNGGSITQSFTTGSVTGVSDGNETGGYYVGGLVGRSDGNIAQSFANGAVNGLGTVGGLVGVQSSGSITNSFATGSVSATRSVGGLVGFQSAGTSINQSYATGSVSGSSNAGGLVGSTIGNISQSFASGAVSADVFAGGLIGGYYGGTISASYWDKTVNPGLTGFGSGTTTGATGLTSSEFATASSFVGWTFGTTAGGAGWVIVDANSSLNNAGGAAGATRPFLLSEASTTGVITNAHQLQLMALNLAGNYSLGGNIDLSETAASGMWFNAGFVPIGSATSANNAFPVQDQSYNQSFKTANEVPFTGNFDGKGFTISNLTINRPTTDYVGLFGFAFSPTSMKTIKNVTLNGGLVIGQDHVGALIGGVRGFDASSQYYVLTVDTVASSTAVTGRDYVGGIAGSLESVYFYSPNASGTVSGRDYVGGVAGYIFSNIGFVQGGGTASGAVSGRNTVGGMFGYFATGLYDTFAATGNVTASGDNVGGLIGDNEGNLSVNAAYATGTVTGHNNVGGLVGLNGGQVTQAFATGAVTGSTSVGGLVGNNTSYVDQSFATGIVRGIDQVGGLVGVNTSTIGALDSSGGTYATGAVYGTSNVGGLVGFNSGTTARILNAYSIGYVSGTTNVGGFVGNSTISDASYIKNAYFNTDTGLPTGIGTGTVGTGGSLTAKTTANLQAALQTGFSTKAWGIVANTTLPYFKWLYASAPQVVTGTAYSDRGSTPLKGDAVNLLVNGGLSGASGAAAAVGSTGANGYYYFLVPGGTFAAAGKQVLVYTADAAGGNTFTGGATFNEKTTASLTGLNIYGTYLKMQATSASTTLSAVNADLAIALGSNRAARDRLDNLANLEIDATSASFAIDQNVSANTLVISAAGSVSQTSGAIRATNLALLGSSASYVLNQVNNNIGTLAANTGAISLVDAGSLAIGSVAGTTGVTSTGTVTLTSGGDVTIASGAKITAGNNANAVIAAAGHFINNRGSDAVGVTGSGRWLIYSADPDGDTFGTVGNLLNSGNTALWNTAAGAAVSLSGNRYVFANSPVLTVTALNQSDKIYGDTILPSSLLLGTDYSITGMSGIAGVFTADTAANVTSSTPGLSSSGFAATANASTTPYTIAVNVSAMTSSLGYSFVAANTGTVKVIPADLIITAEAQSRVYGDANPVLTYTIGGSGLRNGDTLSGALATSASATSNVGTTYAITQNTLAASSNYTLTYVVANLTVAARPITVTADAQSRTYGDANPALTYTIGGRGLVNGDALTGELATSATATSNAGTYAITQNTLAASANYALTYAGADLTVRVPVTVDAALLASTVVRGDIVAGTLPTDASPILDVPAVTTTRGTGVFYADPRFSQVFVCFAGSNGTATSCFAVGG